MVNLLCSFFKFHMNERGRGRLIQHRSTELLLGVLHVPV